MFYHQITNSQADPTFLANARDLLETTSRRLILLICIVTFAWQIISGLIWYEGFPLRFLPASLLIIISGMMAIFMIDRHLFLAQVLMLLGLALGISFYVVALDQPLIIFLLSILPLLAVLMIGWPGGIFAEVLVIAALVVLTNFFPWIRFSTTLIAMTVTNGGVAGIAGFIGISALLTMTQWSVFSYKDAAEKMKLARDRQMNLLHIQDDLIQANNELARLTERMKVVSFMAEEARRTKEEFVANVSHELRTPLNLIIGFSETIIQAPGMYKTRLPAKLMADIGAIHRNSQQLVGLINDVLDLSQIDAGRMDLRKGWCKLNKIIDDAIQSAQLLFSSKGLYLEVEPGLPDIELYCDETRIREVLLNLLSNAGRFTENGGVRVRWRLEGEKVVVDVTDTGPGIAPEDRERLFQPFQQLDNRLNRKNSGSGLGLSISRRFVELHGGQMWLESAPGEGSTFFFSLPLEISNKTRSAVHVPLRWVNEYVVHEKRERAFLAPKPVVRPRYVILEKGNALERIFRHYTEEIDLHYTIDPAGAVEELKRSPTQGLIINQNQDELLPLSYSEIPFDTPLIYCSVPDTENISRHLGVLRYLIKPITRDRLLETVHEYADAESEILIVDDNSEELQLFVRMLESAREGYRVLRATSGPQALEMMKLRKPNLVLLDIKLGEMDGYDVLEEKRVNEQIRDIPVVIISSQDPAGTRTIRNFLEVTRNGGLTTMDFVRCVLAFTEILAPVSPPPAPKLEEGLPAGSVSE